MDRRSHRVAAGTVASIAVKGAPHVEIEHWARPRYPTGPRRRSRSRPIDKFRGTAVGGVLAAGMLGLRDVLEPRKDEEIAIVRDDAAARPRTGRSSCSSIPSIPRSRSFAFGPGCAIRRRATEHARSQADASSRSRAIVQRASTRAGRDAETRPVGHREPAVVELERLGEVVGEVAVRCREIAGTVKPGQ
jgi:hypothetical protein